MPVLADSKNHDVFLLVPRQSKLFLHSQFLSLQKLDLLRRTELGQQQLLTIPFLLFKS